MEGAFYFGMPSFQNEFFAYFILMLIFYGYESIIARPNQRQRYCTAQMHFADSA